MMHDFLHESSNIWSDYFLVEVLLVEHLENLKSTSGIIVT